MVINHLLFNNTFCKILILCLLSFQASGQKLKFKSTPWSDNWQVELKTGASALLTPVPDKYLRLINKVNIPLNIPGPHGSISIKKSVTPHFEMGYQYDYIRIQGKVNVKNTDVEVLTKAYTHNYLIQYNFKKIVDDRPLFNYYLYYRIGGISLKNIPLGKLQDELGNVNIGSEEKLLSNIAVLTSMGAGINYQLINHLGLTCSFDLNRSSDAIGDIYKIHKIFYNSSHTVNSYIAFSFGFSYSFNLIKQNKSRYYKSTDSTKNRILQLKKEQKKRKPSAVKHSTWYNSKRGK
jgi:hypothetical protein